MSFVGTRPEVTKYVKKYTKEINNVDEGSPPKALTGGPGINQRSGISLGESLTG